MPVMSARGRLTGSECFMAFVACKVGRDHHLAELLERSLRLPAELLLRFGRVANEQIDFGGTIVARAHAYERAARGDANAGFALALARPFELDACRREG